jgi:hypothetical protein
MTAAKRPANWIEWQDGKIVRQRTYAAAGRAAPPDFFTNPAPASAAA